MSRTLIGALLVLAASRGSFADGPADLILANGRVWTADLREPWAEAVAIRGDRVLKVGTAAEVFPTRGPRTKVIELGGRLVTPGFNDAHLHLMEGALSLGRVDLIEETTLPGVQARIRAFAAANSKSPWVLGRGWLYSPFPGDLPTKAQLDAAVPDRPSYMECYDGHSGWANSRALALAGINRDTSDPEGGLIVRDPKTHEPTGLLKESARLLVAAKIPAPDSEERYSRLLEAVRFLNSEGITSVTEAGSDEEPIEKDVPLLERALREGKLSVRVVAAVVMDPGKAGAAIARAKALGESHRSSPLLRFGRMKAYVDGVIESHTAALLSPYADDPAAGSGTPNWSPSELNEAVVAADAAGLQVYLHAIGDRAVRMALDAHEAALRANGRMDRRGRIEHIETIQGVDYPRFKELGVIASMQPLHANPDQNNFDVWARNLGPDRASRGFSWRNLEKADARLIFGSDWPVVTPDVFRGLYCAVTRKTRDGSPPEGWLPELAVSLEHALRHYTVDGAFASFDENEKGALVEGQLADIAVLSSNLFEGPPERILGTRVLLTIMGGDVVYRTGGL